MNAKSILCLALILSSHLFASEPATNSQPQPPTNIWKYINYPFPKPQEELNGGPIFFATSGEQYGQESRGLRLDIMNIVQGFQFIKTNGVTARLYRANGEIVEPTPEGKKLLNVPVAVSTASSAGGEPVPQVMTYFPWGANALEECWIEASIGPERYWLEIPYGFDRNPTDPLPPSIPGGPPKFVPAMKSLTEHDHVVRWQNVHYDLGRTLDDCELVLIQSNPVDAKSDVDLYSDHGTRNVYSPHTEVRLLDADGTVINGRCVNLHLDDNHLRRTDTFDIFDRGGEDLRCWGKIEVSIDGRTYCVVVPSSLYKYIQGHAFKPAATAFLSTLSVGMTLEEADQVSRNYIHNGIRNYPVSSARLQYRYVFTPDASEVTLRFDKSDRLVSWK
ncbi:MAG: hypothetical protein ACLQAH_11100 [Limisphaerales bacterium]